MLQLCKCPIKFSQILDMCIQKFEVAIQNAYGKWPFLYCSDLHLKHSLKIRPKDLQPSGNLLKEVSERCHLYFQAASVIDSFHHQTLRLNTVNHLNLFLYVLFDL